jgi:hypothetical protein
MGKDAPRETEQRSDDDQRRELIQIWEQLLWPMYEEGFRHREHWRQRTKEAVESVTDWARRDETGRVFLRTPFPYMACDSRTLTDDDLPWMYLIVGMKLEVFFGLKHVFIAEDVYMDLAGHYHLLQQSVWGMVHRAASRRDYRTWWLHIQKDLESAPAAAIHGKGLSAGPTQEYNVSHLRTQAPADTRASSQTPGAELPIVRRRRKTRAENIASICGYLEGRPDATNADIARGTGIDRSQVSKLRKQMKSLYPQGRCPGRGTDADESIEDTPSHTCGKCHDPFAGPWHCTLCSCTVEDECRTCHFTNSHPADAVP